MRGKRLYTFVIANHAVSRVWRISIPYPVLVVIGIFALIGIGAAVSAGYHYGRMVLKVWDYDHILAENDSFRFENHTYRIRTAQLGEKIDFLETLSTRLRALSDSDALGGVGGYSKESFTQPLPGSAGTLQSLDTYSRRADALETQLREVQENVTSRVLLEAARPNIPPVNGYITQGMGRRTDPFNPAIKEFHAGVDLSAPHGTRVVAPADGIVIFAGPREGYGNMVVIDHKFGITTRYAHLYKMNVRAGQRVSRYDVIGYVGNSGRSTGPHLHYEVWFRERPVNPVHFMTGPERAAENRGRSPVFR